MAHAPRASRSVQKTGRRFYGALRRFLRWRSSGETAEVFPSLGHRPPPAPQRRSPKPTCWWPDGSQVGVCCQGNSPGANGATERNPWSLAPVGHWAAAVRPASRQGIVVLELWSPFNLYLMEQGYSGYNVPLSVPEMKRPRPTTQATRAMSTVSSFSILDQKFSTVSPDFI